MVRGALKALLTLESDITVVADVGRGDQVVDAAIASRPDVALLDVEMPGIDGLAAARALRDALPSCRSLILTTFARPGYLRRALDAGAAGYLLKDAPSHQLADAIRRVHGGLRAVDGLDMLTAYRNQNATKQTPLIVLSSQEEAKTKAEAFRRGAGRLAARRFLRAPAAERLAPVGDESKQDRGDRSREDEWLHRIPPQAPTRGAFLRALAKT